MWLFDFSNLAKYVGLNFMLKKGYIFREKAIFSLSPTAYDYLKRDDIRASHVKCSYFLP